MAADFAAALRLVDSELAERADQVWIIGGSSIYKVRWFCSGHMLGGRR